MGESDIASDIGVVMGRQRGSGEVGGDGCDEWPVGFGGGCEGDFAGMCVWVVGEWQVRASLDTGGGAGMRA